MPIEIRELVIKASVNNNGSTAAGGNDASGISESKINMIVDKVFQIIQQKSER